MTRLEIAARLVAARTMACETVNDNTIDDALAFADKLLDEEARRPKLSREAAVAETKALDLLREIFRLRAMNSSIGFTSDDIWRRVQEFLASLVPGTENKP
jgi:hypothetical protein